MERSTIIKTQERCCVQPDIGREKSITTSEPGGGVGLCGAIKVYNYR